MQALRQLRSFLSRTSGDDPLFGRMLGYASVLMAGTLALAAGLLWAGEGFGSVWAVSVLAATAAIAERGRVQLERGVQMETSISNLPVLFAAVVLGRIPAMVVGAASILGASQWPKMRLTTYAFIRAISGGLTGLVASAAAGLTSNEVGSLAFSVALGAMTIELCDLVLLCLTARLRSKPVRPFAAVLLRINVLSVPLYAPLVGLLAFSYLHVSPWTLPLFFGPALAAQRLFGLYQGERELAEGPQSANVRLERANISFATALVATLDARDRYTAGHSAAVAIYARDIAERLGLSEEQQQLAHLCGLVHDIGKIGLPPASSRSRGR